MTKHPTYSARILTSTAYDGDTIDVQLDLGWSVRVDVRVRLLGIDCPEVRHADPVHRQAGIYVRDFVRRWIFAAEGPLTLHSHELDLYGRSLGTITGYDPRDGAAADLCAHLSAIGYAMPSGPDGKRLGWDPGPLRRIVDGGAVDCFPSGADLS